MHLSFTPPRVLILDRYIYICITFANYSDGSVSNQVECAQNIYNLLEGSKLAQLHEEEVSLEDDRYSLRQDRYPLRTSPQFLGPQIEDILSALSAITQECNSS